MGKFILTGCRDVGAEPTPARRFYLDREPIEGTDPEPAAAYARARLVDGHYALFYHDTWVHVQSHTQEEFCGIEDKKDDGEDVKRVEKRLHGKLMDVVELLREASNGTVEVDDQTEFREGSEEGEEEGEEGTD
jgi:hypothetical protein